MRQIQVLRGQYDSITKGLAGLGLLTNVAQLAGFELPNGSSLLNLQISLIPPKNKMPITSFNVRSLRIQAFMPVKN